MGALTRLVAGRQLDAQQQRLEHTARVIEIMQDARSRETHQSDKLRRSGRRAGARLAHR